jgi:hypothetical protein
MAWVGYIAVGIVLAASVVTAIGVIWKKLIQPTANFITLVGEMKPLLEDLTEVFKDNPQGFRILDAIQAEFRTNDGSSLRDQIDGLTKAAELSARAAEKAATVAESLKVGVEAQRLLSVRDREVMQELTLKLDRVNVRVGEGAATGLRNEAAAQVVAKDLADSHNRADAVSGEAGAAADAAVTRPMEKSEHE